MRDESDTKMKMKVKLSTDEAAKEGAVGLPEAVTRDSTAAGANTRRDCSTLPGLWSGRLYLTRTFDLERRR